MLEIACFNISSVITAAKAGADRIELCANYAAGGVTPSHDDLRLIKKETATPINVMIRPRPGNFDYSDSEFEQMKKDIEIFKPDASGFVFGILDKGSCINEKRNRELVELAQPLPCTFHRAFDQVLDHFKATEQLIEYGFTSILTSGGQPNAVSGAGRVGELQKIYGDQISFILGGGVRSTNIEELKRETNVRWFHSAAITKGGEEVDNEEVTKLQMTLKQSL